MNTGSSQFHLPDGAAQHVPGVVGLGYPDLITLEHRLRVVYPKLRHTAFRYEHHPGSHIDIICPYGNRFKAFASEGLDARGVQPGPRSIGLGVAYIEYQVPFGTAKLISRFYQRMLGAHVSLEGGDYESEPCVFGMMPQRAVVRAGPLQELVFTESHAPTADTGHHIAIYVNHFSNTFEALNAAGLIYSNPNYPDENADNLAAAVEQAQFRFRDIISLGDADCGGTNQGVILQLEHEVRSIDHPSCCFSAFCKQQIRDLAAPSTTHLKYEIREQI